MLDQLRIYISGVHGGVNPSPGVGIARSLREAFPPAHLTAVDFSGRSSGLCWPDFDAAVVRPAWQSIDLRSHAAYVSSLLQRGAIWLSGLDLEIQLLARQIRSNPRLPQPSWPTIKMTIKPPLQLAATLGFGIPAFHPVGASSEEDLSRFCRLHGWPLWVKGTHYDAVPIWTWYDARPVIAQLAAAWGGRDQLFVQAHVEGQDVTIAFAAWKGELLGSAFLEKLDRTQQGKVWAGRISRVPDDIERRLRRLVRLTKWSGGGEIECVRDERGTLWLLECNPRFPAWIYAATQAGYNLPALLVNAMTGQKPRAMTKPGKQAFTRVVVEVPAWAASV
jgi:diaminopimelate decarboxylase